MTAMGSEWRRRFKFRIPVRCLDAWTNPEIYEALCDCLNFLSEDEFEFQFVQSPRPNHVQSYFNFNGSEGLPDRPEEVLLFSGGLDSLAGAVDALHAGKPLALV